MKDIKLTRREYDVLKLACFDRLETAVKLGIHPLTVNVYRKDLYNKLGASNICEAVIKAIRLELISPYNFELK